MADMLLISLARAEIAAVQQLLHTCCMYALISPRLPTYQNKRGSTGAEANLFKGSRPARALNLTRDMFSGDSLAIQLASLDELIDRTLRSGVEIAHNHAQCVAIALAYNVIHDIQQCPQLSNLHRTRHVSCAQHLASCHDNAVMSKSYMLLQADACQCFAYMLKGTTATSELPHGQPEWQFATLNVFPLRPQHKNGVKIRNWPQWQHTLMSPRLGLKRICVLATSSAGSIRVSTGSSACSLNHFCTSPDSMLTSPDSSTVMRTSTTPSLPASSPTPSGKEAAPASKL